MATQNQPAFALRARTRHCARCLSGQGAALELAAARAPCRASCGRLMHCQRALHRREVSLLRRAAVVRRASCCLPESAGFRVARASAPLGSLSLRSEAQHESLLRARGVPHWLWSVHTPGKGTAPVRGLSPSARGRGATCQRLATQNQAAFAWHARAHHCARSLSGQGTALELAAARAPCRAGCGALMRCARALHRRKASLSFGARLPISGPLIAKAP